MSLLSWLTKTVDSDTERFLPSPSRGPELGVPSLYIDAANKSVSTPKTAKRKREYNFLDDKQAAKIGKYALEHGIARCSRHSSLKNLTNQSVDRQLEVSETDISAVC